METDAVAPLIPWYANGSLGAEERRVVEGDLPGCRDCRALLEHARAFVAYSQERGIESLAGHVQAQLLGEFASDPDSLEPDTAQWVRGHLAACRVCRDTHRALGSIVERPEDVPVATSRAYRPRLRKRLAQALAGSVLHPAAAAVYLVALLLAYPVIRLFLGSEAGVVLGPRTRVLPPAVEVYGETDFRGGSRTPVESAPPLELKQGGSAAGDLLLELHPDIDLEDLRRPGATFVLEVRDGEQVVWSETKRGEDFDRGVLRVLLSASDFAAGRDHLLVLRMEMSGGPPEEGIVFRRTIRFPHSASQ